MAQLENLVERLRRNPGEVLTFYGLEKNPTTIRLAKMNLAVHGLEGDSQKAITYYEDPPRTRRQGPARAGGAAQTGALLWERRWRTSE